MIEVTESEIEIVNSASKAFGEWRDLPDEEIKKSDSPMRLIQAKQRRARENYYDKLSNIVLGIVEETTWKIPVFVEEGVQTKVSESLAGVLIDVCLLCTKLSLDFAEIANNFDSSKMVYNSPDDYGKDWLLILYKSVGQLAHTAMMANLKKPGDHIVQIGVAMSRICTAVHWLAFNNDWEPSVIFQSVYERSFGTQEAGQLFAEAWNEKAAQEVSG